jgi:hypothetical protein
MVMTKKGDRRLSIKASESGAFPERSDERIKALKNSYSEISDVSV